MILPTCNVATIQESQAPSRDADTTWSNKMKYFRYREANTMTWLKKKRQDPRASRTRDNRKTSARARVRIALRAIASRERNLLPLDCESQVRLPQNFTGNNTARGSSSPRRYLSLGAAAVVAIVNNGRTWSTSWQATRIGDVFSPLRLFREEESRGGSSWKYLCLIITRRHMPPSKAREREPPRILYPRAFLRVRPCGNASKLSPALIFLQASCRSLYFLILSIGFHLQSDVRTLYLLNSRVHAPVALCICACIHGWSIRTEFKWYVLV